MELQRRNLIVGATATAAVTIAALFWRSRMSSDNPTVSIAAALGETLDRVASQSSYRFDFGHLKDDDLVTVSVPVQFAYPASHPMVTRFLGFTVTASIVIAVELAPHLEYLDTSAALALADRVEAEAGQAGWGPAPEQNGITGRSELGVLLSDPAAAEQQSWYIGRYALGDARLLLRLRRIRRSSSGGQMLLNLEWRDESLADRARDIARRLRREDGLPEDRWRPIDLPRYASRAGALLRR